MREALAFCISFCIFVKMMIISMSSLGRLRSLIMVFTCKKVLIALAFMQVRMVASDSRISRMCMGKLRMRKTSFVNLLNFGSFFYHLRISFCD